jgi:N-acetyltransferase 10
VKVVRKISKQLMGIQKAAINAQIPDPALTTSSAVATDKDVGMPDWRPVEMSVEDELNQAGDQATTALREKQREMIDSLDLKK